ncbi:unnamed protein product, partial [Heligmosomoides polygyrus]|uniref:GRIP domain-containing protein n=1 Tax=Heligmosomoides polygyrus TaxID=6339 RepID=A0A183FUL6_HELPZ
SGSSETSDYTHQLVVLVYASESERCDLPVNSALPTTLRDLYFSHVGPDSSTTYVTLTENSEKEKIAKHYEEMKKELNYLELQNETLSQTLDSKESTVKELERLNLQLMEATLYQQSCSSGSTPLADETESLAEIRPPFTPSRPYTKAHSTLGANLSPTPRPKNSGGLTKSLSNYAIDANCNRRDDVSAAMSRSLRSTQRKLVDSRLLVKCLKETVERLARGENPDISRLLGIKSGFFWNI